jgi:hypothetical protein
MSGNGGHIGFPIQWLFHIVNKKKIIHFPIRPYVKLYPVAVAILDFQSTKIHF